MAETRPRDRRQRTSSPAGASSSSCGAATRCAPRCAISRRSRRCERPSHRAAGPTDRLSFVRRRPHRGRGLGRRRGGLRLRASRRLSARPRRASRPERADRSGTRRDAARASRRNEGRRQARGDDVGRGRRAAAARLGRSQRRDGLGGPADRSWDAYRLSKILAERAAWDFMAGHAGPTTLTTILPGRRLRPGADDGEPRFRSAHPAPAGRPPARHPAPRILGRRRARSGRPAHPRHDLARGCRPALPRGRRLPVDEGRRRRRCERGSASGPIGFRPAACPTSPSGCSRCSSPSCRMLTPDLGRRNPLTSEKARRVLGFSPRPATATVVDSAESLLLEM